jgi:16S rRNA (cytosine1402-N4)-methyltransferase
MDRAAKETAADVLNSYSEEDLKRIFKMYGEVDNAGRLAYAIFHARKEKAIHTVNDLKQAMDKCVRRGRENQYYAQVFQALRIEVNKELDVLKEFLQQSLEILKPGGRLVVISYHSLEDRMVKNFTRSGNFEGDIEKDFYGNMLTPFAQITRKPIMPDDAEVETNNRARSAKLRIVEKK